MRDTKSRDTQTSSASGIPDATASFKWWSVNGDGPPNLALTVIHELDFGYSHTTTLDPNRFADVSASAETLIGSSVVSYDYKNYDPRVGYDRESKSKVRNTHLQSANYYLTQGPNGQVQKTFTQSFNVGLANRTDVYTFYQGVTGGFRDNVGGGTATAGTATLDTTNISVVPEQPR